MFHNLSMLSCLSVISVLRLVRTLFYGRYQEWSYHTLLALSLVVTFIVPSSTLLVGNILCYDDDLLQFAKETLSDMLLNGTQGTFSDKPDCGSPPLPVIVVIFMIIIKLHVLQTNGL